jgi:hypothetical protein
MVLNLINCVTYIPIIHKLSLFLGFWLIITQSIVAKANRLKAIVSTIENGLMNIADTIYQHVKIMPTTQALEVLQFISIQKVKTPAFQAGRFHLNSLLENKVTGERRGTIDTVAIQYLE